MIDNIIRQYDFNLAYARALVADLTEQQMTLIPVPGLENHPAFTLGHLVSGSTMMAEDLGGIFEMPSGWQDLFLRKGPGDPRRPDIDASKYPSKEMLLQELEKQHEKVKTLLLAISPEQLSAPVKWRFNSYFPTMLDLTIFMCLSHENMHLGQLAAWRRSMELNSALATL